MATKAVRDAVETLLDETLEGEDWAGFTRLKPNVEGEVPSGKPAVRVTYPVATSRQMSIGAPGANVWREEGAFRIQIHVETGDDIDQALEWADDLAAVFRGKTFDGVTTWAPTSPIVNERNYQGATYSVSFVVPYWFDIIG